MSETLTPDAAIAAPHGAPPQDRVPLPQKIGYGLGSFHDMWGHWLYPSLVFLVFNIYLGVSPELIGLVMVCKLFLEAIWDSIFGWWSDNTRTRFGRRRPFILVGAILAGICLPLLFAARPGWSESQYFWFMVATLALFVPIMSCFYMPYQSLGAELTPDYHERIAVGAARNAIQKFPELAMFAAGAFASAGVWAGATWSDVPQRLALLAHQTATWLKAVGGALVTLDFPRLGALLPTIFGWAPPAGEAKANGLLGAQVYTVLLGSILVIAGIGVFLLTRERYYEKLVVGRNQGRVSILETLGRTLSCRPFRANLSMALAYGVGTSMIGTLGYYCTVYYVCGGNIAQGNSWNFWMGLAGMVLGFCGIPFYTKIARAIGKKRAMALVQAMAIAVSIGSWWLYTPSAQWVQLIYTGFMAFTGAGFWILYGSMTADVVDYDELQTGKRREGSFFACGSWIMKFGVGLGSGVSGAILKYTGFSAALGGNQTAHALTSMRFLFAAIPVAGLAVALALLVRFPLTPEVMQDIREKLEARRGKV